MDQLKVIQTQSEWLDFIDLPWAIYKNDPFWVPPLKIAISDQLNPKKNPFFKHASMYPLAIYRQGKCVARAIGVVDQNHNKFHSEKTAFFGFFEAIEDQSVVNLLMDEISKWAKTQGMDTLRGPVNLSTNHECGLLVEGYEDTPSVMMNYNPPYYEKLLEAWGLKKSKDLYAYTVDNSTKFEDRLLLHAERLRKRNSIQFRTIKMSQFNEEVERIFEIYNDAWEKNWGFVPLEPEEFRHIAKDFKLILDPRLCLIAEIRGQMAGFALTVPDVNQAIQTVKDGKLLPTGIFKLLWNLKGPGRKTKINRCRIITLGIKKEFQESGIGALLYTEYYNRLPALGYPRAEASWILEDNKPMNKALSMMCGKRNKTYRIYDRTL
jgi:hypothetical protein